MRTLSTFEGSSHVRPNPAAVQMKFLWLLLLICILHLWFGAHLGTLINYTNISRCSASITDLLHFFFQFCLSKRAGFSLRATRYRDYPEALLTHRCPEHALCLGSSVISDTLWRVWRWWLMMMKRFLGNFYKHTTFLKIPYKLHQLQQLHMSRSLVRFEKGLWEIIWAMFIKDC